MRPNAARIAALAILTVVAGLIASAWGYWCYATAVPIFRPPVVSMPEPNGYEQALSLTARVAPAEWSNALWNWHGASPPADIQAQLAPIQSVLDGLRAAMRLDWRVPRRTKVYFPIEDRHSSDFRKVTQCFIAESFLAEAQADPALALERTLDAMELASVLCQGDGIYGRLEAAEYHGMGLQRGERIVPKLPARAVPSALARVRQIRDRWPPLAETWEAERILSLLVYTDLFRSLHSDPLPEQWEATAMLSPGSSRGSVGQTLKWMVWPRRRSIAAMDRYFRHMIAESRKPPQARVPVAIPREPWTFFLPGQNEIEAYLWKLEIPLTHLALLETALAVRMHSLTHGRYPERLTEIERHWLPEVPRDQWGQPVGYRLRGGEPVLYSFGPDGKDDGGRATDATQLTPDSRGDLVFGWLTRPVQKPGD